MDHQPRETQTCYTDSCRNGQYIFIVVADYYTDINHLQPTAGLYRVS